MKSKGYGPRSCASYLTLSALCPCSTSQNWLTIWKECNDRMIWWRRKNLVVAFQKKSVIFHHATLVVFNAVWASSQVMLRGGICWVAVTLDLLSLLSDGDHGGQYPSLWFLFSHNHVLFLKGSVLPWKSASKLIRNVKYLRANTVGAELRKYQWGATTDYVKYSMVSHRNVLFAILRMCKCRNVTLLNLISLWLP